MLASMHATATTTLDATVEEQHEIHPDIQDAPFYVHVQFKVRHAATAKFQATLSRTIQDTHGTQVLLSGASSDDAHVYLTAAISMGPEHLIPSFSAQSLAGYALCESFFTQMFDYAPKYVPVPDQDEASGALVVATGLNMTAADLRAA